MKNLLILHAHDMGRYNSVYGYALPTPRMAGLARRGMVFRDAHCAAPTCSPSRAAMYTGKTAHETGVCGLIHRGWDLREYDAHLAALLGRAGWETAWAGIQHEFKNHAAAPYQQHLTPGPPVEVAKRDRRTAEAAADWLLARKDNVRPFFLHAGFFLPHVPLIQADPERFPASQARPPEHLPDCPQTRADWADYAASIELTDQAVGCILDALETAGLAEATLVVLTTDHGAPLPEMKCELTARGTGVTFVVRQGKPQSGDRASDALVSHLDLVPTVCDLLGVCAPKGIHGRSLRPLLEGGTEEIREDLFAEINYHAASQPTRSVRTKHWNYIRSFDEDRRRPLANCDASRSKDRLLEGGWANRPIPREALYDLNKDPQECINLADDPAHATTLDAMRQRLDHWMRESDDPLRHGPIPLPPGAKCNTRESPNPGEGPYVET